MNAHRFTYVLCALMLLLTGVPGFAASKEIVQLQTQVQQLDDQIGRMQESFYENMGVLEDLVGQQTDATNQINASFQNFQKSLTGRSASFSQRNDKVSRQVQALNDSLGEAQAKLAKFSAQLDRFANQAQSLAQPGVVASQSQVAPPDVLYDDAAGDYYANRPKLASQEFSEYLKCYPTASRAGNAQFYLAEIEYMQGNFAAAAKDYDKVLEQYPGGSQMASAQLKEGLALIQLGRDEQAVREFKDLIERDPRSIEAATAHRPLRKLAADRGPRPVVPGNQPLVRAPSPAS